MKSMQQYWEIQTAVMMVETRAANLAQSLVRMRVQNLAETMGEMMVETRVANLAQSLVRMRVQNLAQSSVPTKENL